MCIRDSLIDALFNLTSVMTGQTIHLCGMLTEAIHTPFLGDRVLAIENAQYVMNTARHFGEEISFKDGGRIETRARDVCLLYTSPSTSRGSWQTAL